MKTPQLMPCPCGGDGLIKPMPELKPFTLLLNNSAYGINRTFGIILNDDYIKPSSLNNSTKDLVIPPSSLNNSTKDLVIPFLKMLLFFPIEIWKIDVITTNIAQFEKPLKFLAFNHNIQVKTREVNFNNTIANTQVNTLMRSIELNYIMKPNTGITLNVLANSKTWLIIHPKQVVTS